jgi:uncharacterized protein with HEPN domain
MHDRLGDKVRIQHMLDAISEIEQYTKGVEKETFVNHSMMFNATLRQLEVIGEAANHISDDIQLAHPEVLWARIIGLRNLVIHEYFGVDDQTIWSIVQINLPVLKVQLMGLLAKSE